MVGYPFSKNNCYQLIGESVVYDETFASNKQRQMHTKRLEQHKERTNDDLKLSYIPVADISVNAHGKNQSALCNEKVRTT
jgi:hypothetical protein